MGKSGEKESLHIYGKGWVRYPNSKRWGDQYFKTQVSLHVYVWEMYHGRPVPDKYIVHHIDGDPANNEIENLIAMSKSEHARLHFSNSYNIDRLRKLAEIGREHAKAWHGSPAGRQFHKEIGKLAWESAYQVVKSCENCGKEYETWNIAECHSRFCSNRCRAAWRRKSGVDNESRTCAFCGAEFEVNRYTKRKYCSRYCSGQARRIERARTTCAFCGQEFEHYASDRRVYCSRKCQYIAARSQPQTA